MRCPVDDLIAKRLSTNSTIQNEGLWVGARHSNQQTSVCPLTQRFEIFVELSLGVLQSLNAPLEALTRTR